MAIAWLLGPDDVARIRFAYSPMWELVASLRTLADPARQAIHRPWVTAVQPRLAAVEGLAELFALVPPDGYIPDFLTPPPEEQAPTFPAELKRIRATPPADAHAEVSRLRRNRSPAVRAFLDDPAAGVERVADSLAGYWEAGLRPHWPRVHGLLEADVIRRTRTLAAGGARALFDTLNPGVTWTGDRLLIDRPHAYEERAHGEGLVLVPSAFHWPAIAVMYAPYRLMLAYPVAGVGTLWDDAPPPAPDGLAALIGRTRALLLVALAEPSTTTALARRLSLTTGAVSQHLSVLRGGGLVVAKRVGKEVYYRRTATGDTLAADAG
jgi:DNA-binding transcriptional ArsR family regulator